MDYAIEKSSPEPEKESVTILVAEFGFTISSNGLGKLDNEQLDNIREKVLAPLAVKTVKLYTDILNDELEMKIISVRNGSLEVVVELLATYTLAKIAYDVSINMVSGKLAKLLTSKEKLNEAKYQELQKKIFYICNEFSLESAEELKQYTAMIKLPDSDELISRDFYFTPEKYENAVSELKVAIQNYHLLTGRP
ncbi:hypothetical protein [Aliikangiella sp. IMCC44359]|uniref:hypothetical protein n=1 Tax=Aliikangiella sp. IMCC44359 TaxID=3459125 RepID=UPI00403AB1D0